MSRCVYAMSTLRASTSVGTIDKSVCGEAPAAVKSYPTAPCVYSSPAGLAASRVASHPTTERAESTSKEHRPKSLHDYLSAQTDVDDEVLQVYKLVCRS